MPSPSVSAKPSSISPSPSLSWPSHDLGRLAAECGDVLLLLVAWLRTPAPAATDAGVTDAGVTDAGVTDGGALSLVPPPACELLLRAVAAVCAAHARLSECAAGAAGGAAGDEGGRRWAASAALSIEQLEALHCALVHVHDGTGAVARGPEAVPFLGERVEWEVEMLRQRYGLATGAAAGGHEPARGALGAFRALLRWACDGEGRQARG